MNFKKIIAITLLAGTCLLAVSCGADAETTAEVNTEEQGTDTDAVDTAADSTADTEAATTDIVIGDPTDEFVMPEGAEGIVGIWKLGGAEGAAMKSTEIWEFKADGGFSMFNVDSDGKVSGNEITGQYRIKDNAITVTMMGMPLSYTYSFSEGKVVLNDHGSDTVLEPYTGSIDRG